MEAGLAFLGLILTLKTTLTWSMYKTAVFILFVPRALQSEGDCFSSLCFLYMFFIAPLKQRNAGSLAFTSLIKQQSAHFRQVCVRLFIRGLKIDSPSI